jgi:hypothetical protein
MVLLACAVGGGAIASLDDDAEAQPRRRPPPRPPALGHDGGSPQLGHGDAGADPIRTGFDAGATPRDTLPMTTATVGAADAGVVTVKTVDGGVQVFQFGEVDIEGRLKSPSLIYFMRRVRAEFAAGELGHRSFLRELSETRKGPSF